MATNSTSKRVAVIGAGASGLPAIKCCLDEGITPVCFERSDHIGGLWHYTDQPLEGQACVMKSTVINTSKEMMSYSDFPIPDHYPNFMHNSMVLKYFRLYAEKFDLEKYIRFHTEVKKIKKTDDFESDGRWEICYLDTVTGEETTEVFDGVLVCTGHHADKNVPTFPGLKDFQGKVVHTHDYRKPQGFEDKRVLIIGIGNSGGDCAVELSRFAKQVYLSTRRGSWVFNRVSDSGYPLDLLTTRPLMWLRQQFPEWGGKIIEMKLNNRFDHKLYSLQPAHKVFAQHPTVNDDLPNRIISGSIMVKDDIKRFTENGVEFVDGTKEDNIDAVILATGYKFGFPFIDKEVLEVKDNRVVLYKLMYPPDLPHHTLAVIGCLQPWGAIMPLSEIQCRLATRVIKVLEVKQNRVAMYKLMYPPDLTHHSLAIIGCIQPLGSVMPISEMQCRLATRVIKGNTKLPSWGEMWTDVRAREAEMAQRYVTSQRHTIQVDYQAFMDEIAELIGCKPNFSAILKQDPLFAAKLYLGPVYSYTYRLSGPGQWSGAKQTILTAMDRIKIPFQTKPLPAALQSSKKLKQQYMIWFFVAVVAYFIFRFLFL